MEKSLLNAIYIDRANFDSLSAYVDPRDFNGVARVLYDYAVDYYQSDVDAKHIDTALILHKLKRNSVKNIQVYRDVLDGFVSDLSAINITNELIQYKREQVADALTAKLVSEEPNRLEDVRELIAQYQFYDEGNLEEAGSDITVYNNVDVADVLETFSEEKLIKLYPSSLNAKIGGGIIPQSHVIIFAAPEVGKSLFTINMAAMMAAMGKLKVLFVEMEDASDATLVRFINNITGISRDDMITNPALIPKARQLLDQRGYKNVTVAEVYNGSVASIEKLIVEHTPDVVFVNQLRQLVFKGVDGDVQKLAMAGNAMRRLAKKHNIAVVSIHQAADSADGTLALALRDMYMSRTALQGDVDLAIGIGWNATLPEDRRMISICKNKANGWHGAFPVIVETQLTRVRSIK